MEKQDMFNFSQMMKILQEVFIPGKPISKAKIQLYFDLLKDLTIEQLGYAVEEILRTKKYSTFPLVSEILEIAGMSCDEKIESDALEAWGELIKLCDTMGFDEPEIEDPILKEAIRIAFRSVKMFGESSRNMEASDRKHFLSVYKSIYRKRKELIPLETSLMKEIMANRAKMLEGR